MRLFGFQRRQLATPLNLQPNPAKVKSKPIPVAEFTERVTVEQLQPSAEDMARTLAQKAKTPVKFQYEPLFQAPPTTPVTRYSSKTYSYTPLQNS